MEESTTTSVKSKAREMLAKTYTGGIGMYTEWSDNYDKDMDEMEFNAPKICARIMAKHLGDKKDARVIDFCAGTGKIAEELTRLGYTNLDAVDGNQDMLTIAKQKNVYKNIHLQFISKEPTPGLETNAYDGAVASGAFYDGGLAAECLDEFVRVVKPGGAIVVVMGSSGPNADINCAIHTLTRQGLITTVDREQTTNHIFGGNGEGIVIRVI